MLSTTQTFFRHIAALTIFFLSVAFHALQGQVLTGPSSVQPGSTHTYYFNDGSTYSPAEWLISGGSQVGSSNHGSQFNVTITWGSAGNGMVSFKSGMYLLGGMAVTIGSPVPVAPPYAGHREPPRFYQTYPGPARSGRGLLLAGYVHGHQHIKLFLLCGQNIGHDLLHKVSPDLGRAVGPCHGGELYGRSNTGATTSHHNKLSWPYPAHQGEPAKLCDMVLAGCRIRDKHIKLCCLCGQDDGH